MNGFVKMKFLGAGLEGGGKEATTLSETMGADQTQKV